jgi:hypothetical protein
MRCRRAVQGAVVVLAAARAGGAGEPVRLTASGGRVAWSRGAQEWIAFDAVTARGPRPRTDVFVMGSDGSGRSCVTCDVAAIPRGFIGQPAWHPDGEHLVLQAENAHSGHRFYNHVSWGIDNDLWLIRRDGTGARRIWATAAGHAALHPHFSADGKRLVFAERVPTGQTLPQPLLRRLGPRGESQWAGWRIHLADVDLAGPAAGVLSHHRTLQPNGPGFYETHGFASDGRPVYSFTPGGLPYVDDCYTAALEAPHAVRNLTNSPRSWDEHARYSPDGRRLAFVSSRGEPSLRFPRDRAQDLRTELFVQEDGGAPRAVTAVNAGQARPVVVSDFDWSSGGRRIVFQVAALDGSRDPELWIVEVEPSPR